MGYSGLPQLWGCDSTKQTYFHSPKLCKLPIPTTQQLVNILLSKIWLSLFCSVPISTASRQYLAFTSEDNVIRLYWVILMGLQQFCYPTQPLQARLEPHPGLSKNTGRTLGHHIKYILLWGHQGYRNIEKRSLHKWMDAYDMRLCQLC